MHRYEYRFLDAQKNDIEWFHVELPGENPDAKFGQFIERDAVDDAVIDAAEQALKLYSDRLLEGCLTSPQRAHEIAYIQFNPYQPVPVQSVLEKIEREGRTGDARQIDRILHLASITPPRSGRELKLEPEGRYDAWATRLGIKP